MSKPLSDLAAGAVRLAAMAQLGPVAGGVFLAGGAVIGKWVAEIGLAGTAAKMMIDDWFKDWKNYLTVRPTTEVFAGVRDLDPMALEYDDGQFRQLWWSRMEPVLIGWRRTHESSVTQLHLNSVATPDSLGVFLR